MSFLRLCLINIAVMSPVSFYLLDSYYSFIKHDFWKHYEKDIPPWCEKPVKYGFIKEKINASSDYVFLLTALYIFYYNNKLKRNVNRGNLLVKLPYLGITYGFINLFHSIGTFINHSCRCSFGHQLDLIGMYAIASFWVPYYFLRYRYYKESNPYLNTTGINLKYAHYSYYLWLFLINILLFPLSFIQYNNRHCEFIEFMVLTSCCIICIVIDYKTRLLCKHKGIQLNFICNDNLVYIGIMLTVTGTAIQKLDIYKIGCFPESFFQLHALWHYMISCVILIAFIHASSEKIKLTNMLPLINRKE